MSLRALNWLEDKEIKLATACAQFYLRRGASVMTQLISVMELRERAMAVEA